MTGDRLPRTMRARHSGRVRRSSGAGRGWVRRWWCGRGGRIRRGCGCLRRTHAPNFQLFDSDREFARWRQDAKRGMSAAEVDAYIRNRGALYGTAFAIAETIERFTDAGCGGFMIFCNAAPAPHALEQLAALTRPAHDRF